MSHQKPATPTQKADSLGLYLLTNSSTAVLIQTATNCSSFISLKLRSCFFSLFKIGKLEVGTQKIPFNPLQVNLYFFQFYSWSSLGSGLICPAIQSVQAETWLPLTGNLKIIELELTDYHSLFDCATKYVYKIIDQVFTRLYHSLDLHDDGSVLESFPFIQS